MGFFSIPSWALAGVVLLCIPAAFAADYVRVEIRGTLSTGIMAIGGETTGTLISAGNVVWELEVPPGSKLSGHLGALNGAEVVVTGSYREKRGVEVPMRHIVTVDSLSLPND